jgi:hypothetical protein
MPSERFMIQLMDRVATYAWAGEESNLECFRKGQIQSKEWLVYEINKFKKDFKKVAVLGSWDSILLYELMTVSGKVGHWDFYDMEQGCHKRRDKYFDINGMSPNYNSFTADVTEIFNDENLCSQYDLIINPSAEHMKDIPAQKGPLYAITSNNYHEVSEHINTIEDYRDLAVKNHINNVLYEGELKLPLYTRFCTVGYKDVRNI